MGVRIAERLSVGLKIVVFELKVFHWSGTNLEPYMAVEIGLFSYFLKLKRAPLYTSRADFTYYKEVSLMKRLIGIALIALMVVSIGGIAYAGVFDWIPIKWGHDKPQQTSCLNPNLGGGGGPGYTPPKCTVDHMSVQGLFDCSCPKKK